MPARRLRRYSVCRGISDRGKCQRQSFATWRTASGPAVVKSWLPILNMPTRSRIWLANLSAVDRDRSPARRSGCFVDGHQMSSRSGTRPKFVSSGLRRLGVRFGGSLHQFQPHLADSRVDQANLPGYPIGYINFASFLIGTPVINTNNFKFAVAGVYDSHPGSEREVRVGGRQTFRR